MADISSWTATGRLTKDAEFRTLASGKGLLTADVAVNTGFGDYKKTTFVKVNQWGDRGQSLLPYLKKGTLIAFTGTPTLNEWTTQTGETRTSLQVDVPSIVLMPSGKPQNNTEPAPVAEDDMTF